MRTACNFAERNRKTERQSVASGLSCKFRSMKTLLTTDPQQAAAFIKAGGLVAFPTETVYGLGADAFNESSLGAVFAAKRRPQDNPLIIHVGDIAHIETVAAHIPDLAHKFIDAFFP